jgi:hypothetical protein
MYNNRSYKELRELAKKFEIPNFHKMKKEELLKECNDIGEYEEKKKQEIEKKKKVQEELKKIEDEQRIKRDGSYRQQQFNNNPYTIINEEIIPNISNRIKPILTEEEENNIKKNPGYIFLTNIDHIFWFQKNIIQCETDENLLYKIIFSQYGFYCYLEIYLNIVCFGEVIRMNPKLFIKKKYEELIKFVLPEESYFEYISGTESFEIKCEECKQDVYPCIECYYQEEKLTEVDTLCGWIRNITNKTNNMDDFNKIKDEIINTFINLELKK